MYYIYGLKYPNYGVTKKLNKNYQILSFTNRCTLYQSYKPLKFTLKLKLNLLLHVSVYDHHQGAYT